MLRESGFATEAAEIDDTMYAGSVRRAGEIGRTDALFVREVVGRRHGVNEVVRRVYSRERTPQRRRVEHITTHHLDA